MIFIKKKRFYPFIQVQIRPNNINSIVSLFCYQRINSLALFIIQCLTKQLDATHSG
jgi:hypothetical protein